MALAAIMGAMAFAAPVQAQRAQPGSVEARLARLERRVNANTMFEILERLEALQRDVQTLRGELEVQGHELAQLKRRQREAFVELDRIANLASAPAASAPTAATDPANPPTLAPAAPGNHTGSQTGNQTGNDPGEGAPAAVASAPPSAEPAASAPGTDPGSADGLAEQSAYSVAFNMVQDGKYEQAAKAFEAFLGRYPAGEYADNAQYWLGETFYVTRQFPRSMTEFEKLIERFPGSPKVPGARLKIGFIHQSLGQLDQARSVLRDLIKRYPEGAPARLARDRLKQLDSR